VIESRAAMTLDALKLEIERLSPAERNALVEWLQRQADEAGDEQIRTDYRAGKLDELMGRAEKELDDGTIREAP
jgi:hypothetical protein